MPIILILIGLVVWVVIALKWQKRQQAEELAFSSEHSGWDVFVSSRDRTAFALDISGGMMAIGKLPKYDRWDLKLLSSVEIEKNGQTAVVTNRGSQALGATVGGLLLGPLGLLMGGVTGSKRQHERVNQLAIKIILNDPSGLFSASSSSKRGVRALSLPARCS
ncbi:MAG: hypothetical protein ABW184_11885 [Sphingobium sp.]